MTSPTQAFQRPPVAQHTQFSEVRRVDMVIVYNSEWNQGPGILRNSGSKAGDTKARFSMVVSTKLKKIRVCLAPRLQACGSRCGG